MIPLTRIPKRTFESDGHTIYQFSTSDLDTNIDLSVVQSFGEEWTKFSTFSKEEIDALGADYFDILDERMIGTDKSAIDFGAGTGRFSKYLSDKVKWIEVVEPSDAIYVADKLLRDVKNIRMIRSSIGSAPLADNAYDFAMSIGVLHHIPDTVEGVKQCVRKIKPGGWFYVYLYYKLDNRGIIFKMLFGMVSVLRWMVSRLPAGLKKLSCEGIAIFLYLPVIVLGRLFRKAGLKKLAEKMPLSYYQDMNFRIIRNDALDRFGTQLEKRFSKNEVEAILTQCGLQNIRISTQMPYWHAVGQNPG